MTEERLLWTYREGVLPVLLWTALTVGTVVLWLMS